MQPRPYMLLEEVHSRAAETHQSKRPTLDRRGSGNPPCGMPMYPCRNSTTDWGKDSSSARSSTSALLRLFCTMNWARSPTILEDGVTWETRARESLVSHSLSAEEEEEDGDDGGSFHGLTWQP